MTQAIVDDYVVGRPAPALREVVDFYSGYRQRGIAPALHRGLPSPYLTLIFTLDEPLEIAQHADPNQRPGTFDTLLGGLHTRPALIRHDGAQSGVQLRVSPLWTRRLFGLPAGELAALDVAVDDVLGAFTRRVHEQLRAAPDWPRRFAVLDAALLDRLGRTAADHDTVPPEVDHAWAELLRTGGTTSVARLVDQTGWSDRHLAARLRAETGLTPKAAGRVVRFDRARQRLQRGGTTIAAVAAEHGYYDQSHLVREFTALAGCAPSEWLATEHLPVHPSGRDQEIR